MKINSDNFLFIDILLTQNYRQGNAYIDEFDMMSELCCPSFDIMISSRRKSMIMVQAVIFFTIALKGPSYAMYKVGTRHRIRAFVTSFFNDCGFFTDHWFTDLLCSAYRIIWAFIAAISFQYKSSDIYLWRSWNFNFLFIFFGEVYWSEVSCRNL